VPTYLHALLGSVFISLEMSSFDRTERKTSVFFIESPKMMQQVYKTLPDDDPILSLCVVEDAGKCPQGYCVVSIINLTVAFFSMQTNN